MPVPESADIKPPTLFKNLLEQYMTPGVAPGGVFVGPDLNLVKAESDKQSQLGTEVNWAQKLEDLSPFRFNTVRVRDGRVTFTAPGIATKDALTIEHLEGELLNLTNVTRSGEETFAAFRASGRALGNAPIALNGRYDPLARQPTFDVNVKLEDVQLPQVNPWLREYIKADAESGQFELYLEAAAADGAFKGYAKPLMSDVDMYRSEEPEESALKRVWENVVDFAAEVLKNDETGDVAARIPFNGTISNPETGVFEAMVSVLRNAFVTAFSRSLEGSISLRDVKKNLRSFDGEGGEKNAK